MTATIESHRRNFLCEKPTHILGPSKTVCVTERHKTPSPRKQNHIPRDCNRLAVTWLQNGPSTDHSSFRNLWPIRSRHTEFQTGNRGSTGVLNVHIAEDSIIGFAGANIGPNDNVAGLVYLPEVGNFFSLVAIAPYSPEAKSKSDQDSQSCRYNSYNRPHRVPRFNNQVHARLASIHAFNHPTHQLGAAA